MQDNKKAFTLIELLAIISITVIMTVALFANYGNYNDALALERSGQKLSQDLRRAQEMAMSGFEGVTSSNGYGIYFDKTSGNETKYIIYMNNNTNMYYESGTDTSKETINIESGIKICDIKDNTLSLNSISVSFEPPDPLTYIDSNYFGHEATIVLCVTKNPTETRTIKVNNIGRIEVTNP
jgi:type II secretory pathway pseudopilin PulG